MKSLLRLFLSVIGLGAAGAVVYFLDPEALDAVGFAAFYLALLMGFDNLFLLVRLSSLHAFLLSALIILFLILQQMRLFSLWAGLALVIMIIIIERLVNPLTNNDK